MKKKVAKLLIMAIGLALILYGAVRSYDFISLTVPPDKLWWGYAGLAASEFGMLAWLAVFLWDEGSSSQSAISLIMLIVDFIGSIFLSSADMFVVSGQSGLVAQIDPVTMSYLLIGLALLVAVNVGAGLAYHAADPDAAKHRAQREAFSLIEEAAVAKIAEHADQLAAELSVEIANDWRTQTAAMYRAKLGKGKIPSLPAPVDVPSNSNGHKAGGDFLFLPQLKRKINHNQTTVAGPTDLQEK